MDEVIIKKVSEKVKKFGVATIQNFLNLANLELIDRTISGVKTKSVGKGDYRGIYPIGLKSKSIKIIKFEFNQIRIASILKKIAEELKLRQIAEKIFNTSVQLHMIDSYYSEKSDKNIIDWHCDMSHSGSRSLNFKEHNLNRASIKFFFYMTDVQSSNGCLAYIPYSHHVVKALFLLIRDKKIEYKPYWQLEDLRRQVLKSPTKDLIENFIGVEKLNIFLNNSKFIEGQKKDTFEFDLQMNKGSVIIFDEFGVHRGSMPSKNSRLVLRFFYRKKI